jgi:hypothetical protein
MTVNKYSGTNYTIVHRKVDKFAFPIDRSSPWGNPFHLSNPKDEALRQECVAKYKVWLWQQIQSGNTRMLDDLIHKRRALGGHLTLGCWCAPRLCHGDVLASACDWWESQNK